MIYRVYLDNVLREEWNHNTRIYTSWNMSGVQLTQRAYTAPENAVADLKNAEETATINRATIEEQAATALETNTTFLAIATPTNAQVLAQTKALTRQTNGVIRLLIGRLESAS